MTKNSMNRMMWVAVALLLVGCGSEAFEEQPVNSGTGGSVAQIAQCASIALNQVQITLAAPHVTVLSGFSELLVINEKTEVELTVTRIRLQDANGSDLVASIPFIASPVNVEPNASQVFNVRFGQSEAKPVELPAEKYAELCERRKGAKALVSVYDSCTNQIRVLSKEVLINGCGN